MRFSKKISKPFSRSFSKDISVDGLPIVDFSKYYQWVFTGKSGEISDSEYTNHGMGGLGANLTIVSGTMEGQDIVVRQPSGDVGLYKLSEAYSLGWYGDDENDPQDVSYATLVGYNLTSVPEVDFKLTVDDGVIKDMISQPYERFLDSNGDQIKDDNGEDIYVLKTYS